jgi:nucleoside-diphosphate-sugar epimerase
MPSFLVAGAGGFIGSHTVEELARQGHTVVALDRPNADFSMAKAAGATIRLGDLSNRPDLADALGEVEYAVNATGLFDLSASPAALEAVNVSGARNFAEAARDAGVRRLVHLSSVGVYGLPATTPMPEDGALRPRSAYEQSKLDGERAVAALHGSGLEVAVIRPTLVYGPRSRYGHALFVALVTQLQALGWRRFPVVVGGPLGHHVHAVDVARAAIACALHPEAAGRAFNVADATPLGLGDTFAAIIAAAGLTAKPQIRSERVWPILGWVLSHLPGPVVRWYNGRLARGHDALARRGLTSALAPRLDPDWLGYFSGSYVYDTSRLRSLGFQPRYPDFRAAIGTVFEWYRSAGWLPEPRRGAPFAPAEHSEGIAR